MHPNQYPPRVLMALAVVVVALSFLGCAPAITVESNRDPAFQVDLNKVFVIIDTRKIDGETMRTMDSGNDFDRGDTDTVSFITKFLPALVTDFEAAGVEIKGHVVTGLELSPADITRRVAEFDADAVLHITESWYQVKVDPGILGFGDIRDVTAIDLSAVIFDDRDGNRAVWKALLKSEITHSGSWEQLAEVLAGSLVSQLQTDGLIDATKQSPPSSKDPSKSV